MTRSVGVSQWRLWLGLAVLVVYAAPAWADPKCRAIASDAGDVALVWEEVEAACGCAPEEMPEQKAARKAFMKCANNLLDEAVSGQRLRKKCRRTLISGGKSSTCMRPDEWTTCCLTNRKDKLSCKVVKSAERCKTTSRKFAELGTTPTCLDACDEASGPQCWEDADCDDGDNCTTDWCGSSQGACQHVPIDGCEPGGGGQGGTSCTGIGAETHGLSAGEQMLVQVMNEYRAGLGLAAVTVCNSLNVAAQDHANDMRDQEYYSHKGENGSEFWERACDAGYQAACGPTTWMGEIITGWASTPEAAFQMWRNSPGHDAAMKDGTYSVAGVGHACGGPLGHYWVVDFAAAEEASCN